MSVICDGSSAVELGESDDDTDDDHRVDDEASESEPLGVVGVETSIGKMDMVETAG